MKPRSIRKLWKDPMTKDGEWGIISMAGTPVTHGRRDGPGAEAAADPGRPPTPAADADRRDPRADAAARARRRPRAP